MTNARKDMPPAALRISGREMSDQDEMWGRDDIVAALRAQAEEQRLEISVRDGMINALQARVAKLEEALRPFAKEAETWSDRTPDDLHPFINTFEAVHFGSDAEFTIGDLRGARDALQIRGR